MAIWFDRLVTVWPERVLPFDLASARIAGVLNDAVIALGRAPGFANVAIAATAKANDLTILTANLKHVEPLECEVFDPFQTRSR